MIQENVRKTQKVTRCIHKKPKGNENGQEITEDCRIQADDENSLSLENVFGARRKKAMRRKKNIKLEAGFSVGIIKLICTTVFKQFFYVTNKSSRKRNQKCF